MLARTLRIMMGLPAPVPVQTAAAEPEPRNDRVLTSP